MSRTPKVTCIWPRTPISKYVVPGTPQKQRFELQKFALKNIYSKIFQKCHDFSKIADLQARSAALAVRHSVPRCELVDLLFLKNHEKSLNILIESINVF